MEEAFADHDLAARRPIGRAIVGVLAVWFLTACAGMCLLIVYSFGGGDVARAAEHPARWPAGTAITPEPGIATLVVVLHPKCPCSRATVAELARLLTHARRPVGTHILVVRPTGAPEGFEHTDLWRAAEAIPGVSLHTDPGGVEATRFGARSSGHVLLFDELGGLLFEGGITPSRGHEGDSAGQDAILALLALEPARSSAPVFGCRLQNPDNESPQ